MIFHIKNSEIERLFLCMKVNNLKNEKFMKRKWIDTKGTERRLAEK